MSSTDTAKFYFCLGLVGDMDLQLDDISVLITAASQGLGRSIAREFVSEGANVVISSRNEANLKTAKESILATTGSTPSAVRTLACDLTVEDEIRSLVTTTAEELDGLDVLITNHGGPAAQTFEQSSVEDFDETYQQVLRSTVILIETALPHLQTEGGGAITSVVSASAKEPPVGHVLSNTIRPGIYGLAKSISKEYAEKGVRVNCVCPRGVMTDRIEYKIDVLAERQGITVEQATHQRRDELPMDRLGDPEEFAKAVVFVSSGAASFTTGSTIHVDGGWSRRAF